MPYPVMNTLLDGAYPKGALNYWLSSFTTGLPDALIDAMVERFASVPSPMTAILLEHFHGAVTRVGPTDTAVPHRDEGWNLLLPSEWMDPADTEANIAWTKDTFAALSEHFSGGTLAQLPRATTRTTRSAPRTARTTTGSSRSSAATTPTTSST